MLMLTMREQMPKPAYGDLPSNRILFKSTRLYQHYFTFIIHYIHQVHLRYGVATKLLVINLQERGRTSMAVPIPLGLSIFMVH